LDGPEDRFSRGAAAAVVVLLHGLFIAALMPAPRLGYVVIPRSQAHWAAVTDPPVALVATFFSSPDPAGATSPDFTKDPAEGALRDVQVEVIQPRDIRLPDAPSTAVAVRSIAAESGEVRIVCEVHIHQGSAGAVQAVDFGACTGDLKWQRSLLHSIQAAARLVSPIQEGPFPPVRTLMMDTDSPSPEVLARQLSEPIARR
jgi:hypothetical protein